MIGLLLLLVASEATVTVFRDPVLFAAQAPFHLVSVPPAGTALPDKPFTPLASFCPGASDCYSCRVNGGPLTISATDITVLVATQSEGQYLCVLGPEWLPANTATMTVPTIVNNGVEDDSYTFTSSQQGIGFYLLTNSHPEGVVAVVQLDDLTSTTFTISGLTSDLEQQFVGFFSDGSKIESVRITTTLGNVENTGVQGFAVELCHPQLLTVVATPSVVLLGSAVSVTTTLSDSLAGIPIQGATVSFTSNIPGSAPVTATTDASGVATASVPITQLGPVTITATYAATACSTAIATTANVLAYAFPSAGIFVIGNLPTPALRSTVNFWGSQWARNNLISKGSIPSAFKGFATSHTETQFTAAPGNSGDPPATVPSYMGVIVTDQFFTGPSGITGSNIKLVVVQTLPGYASNPGHAGNGIIVAIV